MKMQQLLRFALVPIALLIAGCGGGGGGGSAPGSSGAPPVTGGGNTSPQGHMVISIPNSTTSSSAKRPAGISPAASSISITVTGISAPQIADISASSPNCSTSGSGRTCTIPVQAAAGADVFTVTIFDGPNATGNQLATGSANSTVTPGAPFAVNITLAGIIASLQFVVGKTCSSGCTGPGSGNSSIGPPVGQTGSVIGTVVAKDASGNTIIGPYNANVAITSSNPSVSASPSVISGSQPVTFSYDGVATSAITLTATAGTITGTKTVYPSSNILYYQTPTTNAVWVNTGPDGQLYVEEFGPEAFLSGGFVSGAGPGKIARFDPVAMHFTGEVTVGQGPVGMAWAPDGSFFVANVADSTITHVTGFSTVTSATVPTIGSRPRNIVLGSDGNMWFAEIRGGVPATARLGTFSPSTPNSITEYALPTTSRAQGLASGSDGNLYVTDANNGSVYQVSTSGALLHTYTVPNAQPFPALNTFLRFIIAGSDGNLWLSDLGDQGNNAAGATLWKLTTSGTFTAVHEPSPYAFGDSLVQGPHGMLYFADLTGSVGQVAQATGLVTEYPVVRGCNSSNGIGPNDVATAPDGSVWYVGPNCSTVTNPNNPGPSFLAHFVLAAGWTAFPLDDTITLSPVGSPSSNTQLIGIAESGDSSPFTVTSSNPSVATVTSTPSSHNFVVTGVGVGNATITIADGNNNIVTKNVLVTSASGTIQSTGRRIP